MATTSHTGLAQQATTSAGNPISVVITVGAHHGKLVPVINPEDVMVYEGHDRDRTILELLRSTTVAHFDLCSGDIMPHSSSKEPSRIIRVGLHFLFARSLSLML